MAYFPDLSPYTYDFQTLCYSQDTSTPTECSQNHTVNIGWLGLGRFFCVGDTSEEFKSALFNLCAGQKFNQMRGFHRCEVWSCLPGHFRSQPHMTMQRGDQFALLGSAEIRVPGPDKIYAAPNMIYHYVVDHRYKPRQEFIDAVLNCPLPDTPEFWQRYEKLETVRPWNPLRNQHASLTR